MAIKYYNNTFCKRNIHFIYLDRQFKFDTVKLHSLFIILLMEMAIILEISV